jgi:hypothetical protein
MEDDGAYRGEERASVDGGWPRVWRRGESKRRWRNGGEETKLSLKNSGDSHYLRDEKKNATENFIPNMRKSLFPYVLWLNRIPYVSHVNIKAREIALNSRVQELSFIGLGNGVPLKVLSFVRVYRVRAARARWSVS